MLDWRITSHHPSDTLGACIRYCSANLYNTYTMYHPPDVRWHVLNDTMSQYYLCHHRIFGLNALNDLKVVQDLEKKLNILVHWEPGSDDWVRMGKLVTMRK